MPIFSCRAFWFDGFQSRQYFVAVLENLNFVRPFDKNIGGGERGWLSAPWLRRPFVMVIMLSVPIRFHYKKALFSFSPASQHTDILGQSNLSVPYERIFL